AASYDAGRRRASARALKSRLNPWVEAVGSGSTPAPMTTRGRPPNLYRHADLPARPRTEPSARDHVPAEPRQGGLPRRQGARAGADLAGRHDAPDPGLGRDRDPQPRPPRRRPGDAPRRRDDRGPDRD